MGRYWQIFSGALLISGTAIGAGMLAMPVVTGGHGFIPSLVLNALCWSFMTCTALLLLEAVEWLPEGAHFLSLSRYFLGRTGEWVGGACFLFLYYCLMVSYIAGGSPLLAGMLRGVFGWECGPFWAQLGFTAAFFVVVALGSRSIDRVNTLLMAGMVFSYVGLLGSGVNEVSAQNLSFQEWPGCWMALPVLFSAFAFHNVIPSLAGYFHKRESTLRWAIVWGALAVFVVYSLWQGLVLGTISQEVLLETSKRGSSVAEALQGVTGSAWVRLFGLYFSFFALVTSLLGVSFSMVDFLGDGLGITQREGWRRFGLTLLVFVPSFVLAGVNPGVFVRAIGYAGGFGEALLNGLFPIFMVWVGRYRLGLSSHYPLPGGRLVLSGLALFTLFVAATELWEVIR